MHSGQYGEGGNPEIAPLNVSIEDPEEDVEMNENSASRASQSSGVLPLKPKNNSTALGSPNIVDLATELKNADKNVNSIKSPAKQFIENKYNLKLGHLYSAPYYAYIEHSDKNIGKLHPMALGKFLHIDLNIKHEIVEITKVGLNRVKVELKSAKSVNNLIENPLIKAKGYVAYVPKHLTERRGVIRGVCTSLDDASLIDYIESFSVIKSVKRVYRKSNENAMDKLIPTQTVFLTFEGNSLPSHIFLNSVRCTVEPYISNVIQCNKCFKFRHVAAQCRSTKEVCPDCGNSHEGECYDRKCSNCGSNQHSARDKNCEKYKKEKDIKTIMGKHNMSYKEAENIYKDPNFARVTTSNRFNVLNNIEHFPELPTHSRSQSNQNQSSFFTSQVSNKKRKTISPAYTPSVEREYNTFNLPLNPLPPNPIRPNGEENPNFDRLLNVITECCNEFFSRCSKDFQISLEDELSLKRNINTLLSNNLSVNNPNTKLIDCSQSSQT